MARVVTDTERTPIELCDALGVLGVATVHEAHLYRYKVEKAARRRTAAS